MTFERDQPAGEDNSAALNERESQQHTQRPVISGWRRVASILGPGIITASAGNDAGGIATYAQAGAQWKYNFIWLMVVITFCLIIVQEMCARMGAVTGKGLSDLIREKFGPRWTLFAVLAILIANGGTVVTEFAGIAAALELVGVTRYISVPLMAFVLWWLVVKGTYGRVKTIFLVFSMVFLTYIPAAFISHPHWREVGMSTIHPAFYWRQSAYTLALVALIGTTITPYMQIMLQSSVAEEGVTAAEYPRGEKWDTILGCIYSDIISVFIIVATAVALFHLPAGSVQVKDAGAAAQALRPVAGPLTVYLFALGLFGASVLAGAVLPLATSYSVCESLGFQTGLDNDFRDAKVFYILFTGLLFGGAAIALIPGIDPLRLMYYVQAIEGCILPIILIFIMLIINDSEVMTTLRNGPVFNFLAWTTTVAVSVVAFAYLLMTYVLPLFGVKFG
ncbi:MAG TPA: Nramp family divalent metal transporter [Armatimonadota bacterium]|nr:Nramp family divalent metal transporter [Armatimonadota bacterium]